MRMNRRYPPRRDIHYRNYNRPYRRHRTNTKTSKGGAAIMLSIILIIVGIVFLVKGEMEAFIPISLLIVGGIILVTAIVSFFAKKINKNVDQEQEIDNIENTTEELNSDISQESDQVKPIANLNLDDGKVVCKYCNAKYDEKNTRCPYCGAPPSK